MQNLPAIAKEVSNREYEKIKKENKVKGVYVCELGKLLSALDTNGVSPVEYNFYSRGELDKCLLRLAAMYGGYKQLPRRDISKGYAFG